jgi:hypothetical protein
MGISCSCSCWRLSSPSSCIVTGCHEAVNPASSALTVISISFSLHFCPCATPFIVFANRFVMPTHLSLASSWRASHFYTLSCIHDIIPSHCASSRAALACNSFATCPTVRCSCVSSCFYSLLIHYLQLLQDLGVGSPSYCSQCIPSSILAIGSHNAVRTVTAAKVVAQVVSSFNTSVGASHLLSPTFLPSRSLLSLTLNLFITAIAQASYW